MLAVLRAACQQLGLEVQQHALLANGGLSVHMDASSRTSSRSSLLRSALCPVMLMGAGAPLALR
eukprot:11259559-Alexandrium_andersonii.AAC.1